MLLIQKISDIPKRNYFFWNQILHMDRIDSTEKSIPIEAKFFEANN